jgi:prefoldin subunit 5
MLKDAIQSSVLQDVLVAKTTKQFQIELKDVDRQIDEIEAPLCLLEAEIGQIRATIERGKALSVSDHADFLKQGGDLLIAELQEILASKLSYLDDLRAETQNLQEPLQITKSNLLALLAQKQEKT